MTQSKKMKKKAILPNILTALSLLCGLFVIFKANMVPPGEVTYLQVLVGTIILLVAAILDVLDGAIARALKAESEFGINFDSLSDAVVFGVAPAVLILKTLSMTPGTLVSFCVMTGAMVYSISGVLRLVRFNVSTQQVPDDTEQKAIAMKHFTGLPITAAAACVTSMSLLLLSADFQSFVPVTEETRAYIAAAVFVMIGFFMVSRWKFPSVKALRFRVGSFQLVFLTTVVAAALLVGMLHHFPLVFAGCIWSYFIVAIVLSMARIIAGKRLQALEDFEPESEDEE